MPEAQTPEPTEGQHAAPDAGALFHLLLTGKRDPGKIYTAIREMESMVGQSVVVQLTAKIEATAAEQTARFMGQIETVNARLDAVQKQLNLIWTLLFLMLGTLVGTLTTLLLRT